MINNVCQKIPQKNPFFWNCSKQKLWPGRKNTIFSHNEDSQNIVIFSASDVQKTAKIRPPPRWVRCHNKNKYPRQGKGKAFFQPWKAFFQPQSFFSTLEIFFSTLPVFFSALESFFFDPAKLFFHLAWFFSALRP